MGLKSGLLTLREEGRSRIFENEALRRTFVPESDIRMKPEKSLNEGVHNFQLFAKYNDEVKEDELGRECSTHRGEEEFI
jgi:hypothetical protein